MVQLAAPQFQFSGAYPMKLLNDPLAIHTQKDLLNFEIWYKFNALSNLNVTAEDYQFNCLNRDGAIMFESSMIASTELYYHTGVQAIACATMATESYFYQFIESAIPSDGPVASMVLKQQSPWKVKLENNKAADTASNNQEYSIYWQPSNITHNITCDAQLRDSSAVLYQPADSSTFPTITNRLGGGVMDFTAIECLPQNTGMQQGGAHGTPVTITISEATEPIVTFAITQNNATGGTTNRVTITDNNANDIISWVTYTMGVTCDTTATPSCESSKLSYLLQRYTAAVELQDGKPPFVKGPNAYIACVKAVSCSELSLPSTVASLDVSKPHSDGAPVYQFEVKGKMKMAGYTTATFTTQHQAVFKNSLATALMVLEVQITLTVSRRRDDEVVVEYTVATESNDQAADVEASSNSVSADSSALTLSLQEGGLDALESIEVTEVAGPTTAPTTAPTYAPNIATDGLDQTNAPTFEPTESALTQTYESTISTPYESFDSRLQTAFTETVANLAQTSAENVIINSVSAAQRRSGVVIQYSVTASQTSVTNLLNLMADTSSNGFAAMFVLQAAAAGVTIEQPTVTTSLVDGGSSTGAASGANASDSDHPYWVWLVIGIGTFLILGMLVAVFIYYQQKQDTQKNEEIMRTVVGVNPLDSSEKGLKPNKLTKDWYRRGNSALSEEVTKVAWDCTSQEQGLKKGPVDIKNWQPMQAMDLSSDDEEESFYCGEPVSFDVQSGGFDVIGTQSNDSLPGTPWNAPFGKATLLDQASQMEHHSVPSMQVTGFHTSESPNDAFRVPEMPAWLRTIPELSTHTEYLSNPPVLNLPPLRALKANQSAEQLTNEEQAWIHEEEAADSRQQQLTQRALADEAARQEFVRTNSNLEKAAEEEAARKFQEEQAANLSLVRTNSELRAAEQVASLSLLRTASELKQASEARLAAEAEVAKLTAQAEAARQYAAQATEDARLAVEAESMQIPVAELASKEAEEAANYTAAVHAAEDVNSLESVLAAVENDEAANSSMEQKAQEKELARQDAEQQLALSSAAAAQATVAELRTPATL
jgi:hypothetical protein